MDKARDKVPITLSRVPFEDPSLFASFKRDPPTGRLQIHLVGGVAASFFAPYFFRFSFAQKFAMISVMDVSFWLDVVGITAFAATGALLAGRHGMDLFGALTLAFVTGIGGGTLRDIILDAPVFWLTEAHASYACLAGFILAYVAERFMKRTPKATINLLDALGLAVFSVLGAEKTLELGYSPGIAILMGFLTGCGGGMLRDVLANDVPLVFSHKKLYATPSVIGAAVFVGLHGLSDLAALFLGAAATFGIRIGSLFFNWRLPKFPQP